MGKREKKFNKWIIGAVIGGTIIGLGSLSMTPKGKSFWRKVREKIKKFFNFLGGGLKELKKKVKK